MMARRQSKQSKIDAIKRLIDPNSGATDGERKAAKAALERIFKSQFGESGGQQRLDDFYVHFQADTSRFDEAMARAFTGADFVRKKRAGVNMSGEWTGTTIEEAVIRMCADMAARQMYRSLLRDMAQVLRRPLKIEIKLPKREKPLTQTETIHTTRRESWDKHRKKEDMKEN